MHQLPQVRDALLRVLSVRYPAAGKRPWLRSTRPRAALAHPKAVVIAALGSHALGQRARAAGFAQNTALLGVYDFAGNAARYRRLLGGWLAQVRTGDVLMCHPAAASIPGDAIAPARAIEYQVLGSDWFENLLREAGCTPAPMGPLLAAAAGHST